MKYFGFVIGFLATLTAIFASSIFNNSTASAAPRLTGMVGRSKIIDVQVTRYVWQLVRIKDGLAVCEITIDHQGQPTLEELMNNCYSKISALLNNSTPSPEISETPTPVPTPPTFNLSEFYTQFAWQLIDTVRITRSVTVPMPDILVYLTAPDQVVKQPYVRLLAYDPVWDYKITTIRGKLNDREFVCDTPICEVPIRQDSSISFWASSSSGDNSPTIQATIRISVVDGGYRVSIFSSTRTSFVDACAAVWGDQPQTFSGWANFPASPDLLNTNTTLHILVAKLITNGIVDARSCPGSGLFDNGAPNACGLEIAHSEMVRWQNQFDPVIWIAGRDVGIPPTLIKALIKVESQFWPTTSLANFKEYGFGQLTQMGADVALRWDDELFKQVCNGLLYDCNVTYSHLPNWLQSMVSGGLLQIVNAECSNCPFNVNLSNAASSLPIFARTLKASCNQVNASFTSSDIASISYEDLWKLTVLSYHSGYQCLTDALTVTRANKDPLDWFHISSNLKCEGAQSYVDSVWADLNSMGANSLKPVFPDQPEFVPTFAPTPTPISTPTPVLAKSHLKVLVFIDTNRDQIPQPDEMVNDLTVKLTFADGSTMTQITSNGTAEFDLTGKVIDSNAVVSIPILFRDTLIVIPASGEVTAEFRLDPPTLPGTLP